MQNKQEPNPLNIIIIDEEDLILQPNPYAHLKTNSIHLYNEDAYEDDLFKLPDAKEKGIVRKRLKDIYKQGSSLQISAYRQHQGEAQWSGSRQQFSRPTYLSEMKMLPEWHFLSLIEPREVNCQGFYHVAVIKDGRILKKTIDDYVYYDQIAQRIVCHPMLEDRPWVHIILKTWAKLNVGYALANEAEPFSFIQAFTFPEWSLINPGREKVQSIISRFSNENKRDYFYVARTKEDPLVGCFGLIPNCSSYVINGYYQEYGNIFLKVRSFVKDKWNGSVIEENKEGFSENIELQADEFIIPLKQFINIFHLVYYTTHKYEQQSLLHYRKFPINLDARESKARFISFKVSGNKFQQYQVNLNLYFPSVKHFDLAYKRPEHESQGSFEAAPHCKVLIGREIDHDNIEGSYADSLREDMLKNQEGTLLRPNEKYEYVRGDYFRGYKSDVTYHLKLKPGKYILRVKIEKMLAEYRARLNITSNAEVKIAQNKMGKDQQIQFLAEVLSNRARKEQKNIAFPFPHQKETWIMMNNDYDCFGYSSIIMQIGRNDHREIIISLDQIKLKEAGYKSKDKAALNANKNQLHIRSGESAILILKESQEEKVRQWPPLGIQINHFLSSQNRKIANRLPL